MWVGRGARDSGTGESPPSNLRGGVPRTRVSKPVVGRLSPDGDRGLFSRDLSRLRLTSDDAVNSPTSTTNHVLSLVRIVMLSFAAETTLVPGATDVNPLGLPGFFQGPLGQLKSLVKKMLELGGRHNGSEMVQVFGSFFLTLARPCDTDCSDDYYIVNGQG